MATLASVSKKLRRVIERFDLSINSSEDDLRAAISGAHSARDVKIAPGITVHYAAKKSSVFPEFVMIPYQNADGKDILVADHRWGDGSNEKEHQLLRELKEMLLGDQGWMPFDWRLIRVLGEEKIAQMQLVLKETRSPRGWMSPYSQDYWREFEVAVRVGEDVVVDLFRSGHWKGWAETVNWMHVNPGFELLGPWQYIFEPKQIEGSYEYDFDGALQQNEYCLEAVRRFRRLATHAEMGRIISILARHPQPFDAQQIVRWIMGHKSWGENKDEAKGSIVTIEESEEKKSYIKGLLSTVDDVEKLPDLVSWNTQIGILANLRDVIFGWTFDDVGRNKFFHLAKNLGFKDAWKMVIEIDGYYGSGYSQRAEIGLNAADKLGRDTLLKFFPNEGMNDEWLKRLGQLVGWYIQKPGESFVSFEEFEKRATKDGWGEQVNGWFNQLADVVGEELAWDYMMRRKDYTSPHDKLFFVGDMILKLDAYSIRRIIGQTEEFSLLAQLVNAYAPDGTRFDGWRAFVKHVNMQRYSVVVPNDDPVLKAAVNAMLDAPGINIQAIKSEMLKDRFIRLVKGEMDEQAFFQPAVKFYYLTPTHELVRIALGTSGKAERYAELRQKLAKLEKAERERRMSVYRRAKARNHKINVPQAPDFAVLVPRRLKTDVLALLAEHGVEIKKSLEATIRWAIGELPRSEKTTLLFSKLKKLAHVAGLKFGVQGLLRQVPDEIEEKVWRILEEHKVPMGPMLKAEVLKKSDPRGWVCGDWVVCCMSFGSTKNWDYMYKRSFVYFVVSLVKSEGDERIIAQSVVDATIHSGKEINPETTTILDVDAWVLDNIEAHANYREYFIAVANVYRRFWTAVTSKRVMVGAWHNDIVAEGAVHLPDATRIRELWKPLESMEYSDFFGASECEVWLLQEGGKDEKG